MVIKDASAWSIGRWKPLGSNLKWAILITPNSFEIDINFFALDKIMFFFFSLALHMIKGVRFHSLIKVVLYFCFNLLYSGIYALFFSLINLFETIEF